MNEKDIKQTIERWKILAESLINTNTKGFIVDINDTYHWCEILRFDDNKIVFKNFKGNNVGFFQDKFWAEIVRFDKYKEVKG